MLTPQEEATVRAFIVKQRRDRWLELLAKPKKRRTITDTLAHADAAWFEPRYVRQIPPSQSSPVGIAALLKAKGAANECWVISEDSSIDGKRVELVSTLEFVVGYGMGTILCCVPGKLAFVETEDERFILERP